MKGWVRAWRHESQKDKRTDDAAESEGVDLYAVYGGAVR